MLKNRFFIFFITISLLGVLLTSPPMQMAKYMVLGFLAPFLDEYLEKKWENRPTIFLLWELMSYDYVHADVAANILSKRKEKMAVPILLIALKSPLRLTYSRAMFALGEIGDESAIKPLMSIVKSGVKHPKYASALSALSIMAYKPVLSILLKMVEGTEEERARAVLMLGNYKDKDLLPLLMKIASSDKEDYIRNRAKEAIENITKKENTGGK